MVRRVQARLTVNSTPLNTGQQQRVIKLKLFIVKIKNRLIKDPQLHMVVNNKISLTITDMSPTQTQIITILIRLTIKEICMDNSKLQQINKTNTCMAAHTVHLPIIK